MATAPAESLESVQPMATGSIEPLAAASSMGVAATPTEEEIRFRAYFRYLERGAGDGGAFDDWLLAERELKKN
jgi:hypothetical protein